MLNSCLIKKLPLRQQAMHAELQALKMTHTLRLHGFTPGKLLIGCKLIYKIKTHYDGSIERYKVLCLVAKGYLGI